MSDAVGILVVDKPAGMTSHGVVSRVRRALGLRKVGHAGTLDPDATGVLVLGIGQATRLLGYLAAADKEYASTVVLGQATVTDDAAGDTISWADAGHLTRRDVEDAMASLTGRILQRPSSVSAIKVEGRRAYDLVRSGAEVDLASRPVTIHAFDVRDFRLAERDGHRVAVVDVHVACSSGTYVRALARDLGVMLEVGGHVETLRRTRSGDFSIDDAIDVDDLDERTPLLSPAEAARRSLPVIDIDAESARLARHGVQLPWPPDAEPGPVAFVCGTDLVGVAVARGGRAAWAAVFG